MDDADTATVELSHGEAREVVNALSGYHVSESGRAAERALNVRELFQREFGFDDGRFDDEGGLLDPVAEIFGEGEDDREIQLSRAEAAEIVPALAEQEAASDPSEAETIAALRDRLERTFDLSEPGSV